MSILSQLLEMGFAQSLAERAVKATGGANIDATMDWLMAHADDPEPDSSDEAPADETPADAAPAEAKAPLTEEEKREQLLKVEELMRQKRKEREAREEQERIEAEKRRIRSGKELLDIKKKFDDQELRRMAEERRREKEEDKKARQRVRDQIEQDKLARKMKAAEASGTAAPAAAPPVPAPAAVATPAAAKDYKETRIQIRLTDGSTLTQSFGVKEQLAAVRLFVQMKRDAADGSDFKFQTNFPRRVFTVDDYEKPLDVLGLVPSAVLILSKVP